MILPVGYIQPSPMSHPAWWGGADRILDPVDDIVCVPNHDNSRSPVECYQIILDTLKSNPIIVFMHDDVSIFNNSWEDKVAPLFNYSDTVAVGFGGAMSLGNWDLVRKPYQLNNFARGGYCSNQTDAEVHGTRFEGDKQVAVLDAFFMAVRTSFLTEIGGWPTKHLTHHCLDLWLACEAARHRKQIWMTGVSCTHHGGGMSTTEKYAKAKWLQGGSMEEDHRRPHKWLYDNYMDVLPIEVGI